MALTSAERAARSRNKRKELINDLRSLARERRGMIESLLEENAKLVAEIETLQKKLTLRTRQNIENNMGYRIYKRQDDDL